MKITDIIIESSAGASTSGGVATVSAPLFTAKRGGNLLTGKKTSKKYANSLTEGKMKELSMDLSELSDAEFKKKYGKTKAEMRQALGAKPPVSEAELKEDDLIVIPGQRGRDRSFTPHDQDRTDHELEMALADLFQSAKNSRAVYMMLRNRTEEDGVEGWVQEKIIKANDYLNTVREYLEGKNADSAMGVVNDCGCDSDCDCRAEDDMMEVRDATLKSYQKKVSADTMKHHADPTKRSPEKASRSVAGYAAAQRRLEKGSNTLRDQLDEVAVSQAQQAAAAIALKAKRSGEKPKAGTPSASMAKMSTKELEKYAGTSHKGLPKHVSKK